MASNYKQEQNCKGGKVHKSTLRRGGDFKGGPIEEGKGKVYL